MAPSMTSVTMKAQKRPLSFEQQLAAADQPIVKRPKALAKPAAVQKPAEASTEPQDSGKQVVEGSFHDPTTGRKTGHCPGAGRPIQTKMPLGHDPNLLDRSVRELELLFSYNKKIREEKDHIWEDVARREFSIKLEKRAEESWYSFFKRTQSAEEARLSELASRISAKQQEEKAKEKATKVCNTVAPQKKKRWSKASSAGPTIKSVGKTTNGKVEKKKGPTPLMRQAMKMAKSMRR
ncbi:unnamed protein product [Bursaphelenchus xylophilus]|uniref:(pine wood nematode) hypothetical protein n=1 Tax=Bursaphelenchus xylophilus TaxID=6326 RepID=A0A1I7SCJ6_BURXY|nr:unnamed protein product [Bursaphelenchus xylophilus]CAG9093986.1 unnamed protein product [Bursaphelenchus xylophilus]